MGDLIGDSMGDLMGDSIGDMMGDSMGDSIRSVDGLYPHHRQSQQEILYYKTASVYECLN